MKTAEIRKAFSEFFKTHDHQKIQSSSLVPENDPTLLFANAGMNQFKDYFTGKANPSNRRAVTIQKVVRAGGKHNDLENVGLTARHHTFFEMLGNFSFGDYFKEEAIKMAWEFLTVKLAIPKEKLFVSVHEGDQEAFDIWKDKIGIDPKDISKRDDKDNFWSMGDVGPCGPCSEIFYDHGPEYTDPNGPYDNFLDDESRYVEIWNLVFMQFEQTKDGRRPLPNPSIDTGAGLERVAACLQGVYWNYDIDSFQSIISECENLSGKKYTDERYATPMRVVADHIRSSVMLITDGVIPSNEGRGYVLRRIIRRAIKHLRDLEIKEVSFYKLVPKVFESLGEEYPQNANNQELAIKFLKLEEEKFLETLENGMKFLTGYLEKECKNSILPGEIAFKLYDTYGFPVDLTEIILKDKNMTVDQDGFTTCMEKQKNQSRKSWKGGSGGVDLQVFHQASEQHGDTKFLGYESLNSEAKFLGEVKNGDLFGYIFDSTPFYAESGGQAGDSGQIFQGDNLIGEIVDTQKPVGNTFIHYSKNQINLKENETYNLQVHPRLRELTKRNHSATHLLQAALAKVLGPHVKQAGSQVSSEKLRFDFTHHQAMTKEELQKAEELVLEQINKEVKVSADVMTKDEALKRGALAFFGEKYGNSVRVLQMGDFSIELCGGTHVDNTSEIQNFLILMETSLSSGVRRIEATTSETANQILRKRSTQLKKMAGKLNCHEDMVEQKMEQFQAEIKKLNKEIKSLKQSKSSDDTKSLFNNLKELKDYSYAITNAPEGADLKSISDAFVDKYKNGILFLYHEKKGKLSLLVRTNKNNKAIKCSDLLNQSLALVGGRGGGRPDMAQGSGSMPSNLDEFNKNMEKILTDYLS